jgi:hypothetical protein
MLMVLGGINLLAAPVPIKSPTEEQRLLREVALPPLGLTQPGQVVTAVRLGNTLPMKYADKGLPQARLRKVVGEVQILLWSVSPAATPRELRLSVENLRKRRKLSPTTLVGRVPIATGVIAEAQVREQVLRTSKDLARMMALLENALEEITSVEDLRDKECPRWQAHYDLLRVWLMAQMAHVDEHVLALGTIRKEFPPYDPREHKAWQLMPAEKLSDVEAKKRVKISAKLFQQLQRDHPNTIWATLAERARRAPLGVYWQPVR